MFHASFAACTKHFRARWLSTLGVAELDHARTAKTLRQTIPDVQHASINQQLEHEYETVLSYPCKNSRLPSSIFDYVRNSMMLHNVTQGTEFAIGESFVFTKRLLQVAYQHAQKKNWYLFRIVITTALSSRMEVGECLIM